MKISMKDLTALLDRAHGQGYQLGKAETEAAMHANAVHGLQSQVAVAERATAAAQSNESIYKGRAERSAGEAQELRDAVNRAREAAKDRPASVPAYLTELFNEVEE